MHEVIGCEYIARVLDAEYPVFRIVAPDSGKILYFRMLSLKEYERLSGLRGDSLVHEWLFYEEVFKYSYLSEYNLPDEKNYFDPTKVLSKRECGLHVVDGKFVPMNQQES